MSNDTPRFRSILVPLDGSPLAEEALPVAARIARQGGGTLRLALVHEPTIVPVDSPDPTVVTAAEAVTSQAEHGYLRRTETGLRESGTKVASAVTLEGATGPALAAYATEAGVDLVVMATHGRGGVKRLWLGSVADHLIRHLDVPVLLVRQGQVAPATAHPTQILVPLDGSELAEEALEPAEELARIWGMQLELLRVVPPVTLVADPAMPVLSAYDNDLTDACRTEAQDYLDDLVNDLRARGDAAGGAAVIGWNAAEIILECARPDRVALVAIATHGRSGIPRAALGSVADTLVRGASVPVLVYRPGGRRAAILMGLREHAGHPR